MSEAGFVVGPSYLLPVNTGSRRFRTSLLLTFAGLALLLACVGVYGIVAYDVARRTREIGIRIALGAGRNSVIRMLMGRSRLPVSSSRWNLTTA